MYLNVWLVVQLQNYFHLGFIQMYVFKRWPLLIKPQRLVKNIFAKCKFNSNFLPMKYGNILRSEGKDFDLKVSFTFSSFSVFLSL